MLKSNVEKFLQRFGCYKKDKIIIVSLIIYNFMPIMSLLFKKFNLKCFFYVFSIKKYKKLWKLKKSLNFLKVRILLKYMKNIKVSKENTKNGVIYLDLSTGRAQG